jgi:hypothetical protein
MCQVNGCSRFGEPDPKVQVKIPGHVNAKVELCPEHEEAYRSGGYIGGLVVPDGSWAEYLAEHHGIIRGDRG